ncbi:MAG: uracil-DNA glycosylase family protein [Bacteroidetes bacterium]|nr:uracil-DNA glycosylase family protein [Bacteroidota bacterium]
MPTYTEKLKKLNIANPTLRDCFDPASSEFSDTTMEQKIVTLQKVIANGFSLQKLTTDYCKFYEKLNKPYVAKDLHQGLKTLINNLLQKHTSFRLKLVDNYSNKELVNALTILLEDTTIYPIEAKEIFYKHLVDKRKKYVFNDTEIFNPSELKIAFDEHLNAWGYWHGNLNADILLIGQDFGDYNYYINNDGKDDPTNATNVKLSYLFGELGIDIGQSDNPNTNAKLYFTNAVLGVKKGGMAAPIKKAWYADTAKKFIKPLIQLIEPKTIIAMGSKAYEVISIIYNLDQKRMKEVVDTNPILLDDNKKLFVVYHCSNLGIANRSFIKQCEDWRKIKLYLDQNDR